jgi:hypothetical protein
MIPKHIQDQLEVKYNPGDPIPRSVVAKTRKPCDDCGLTVDNRTTRLVRQMWRTKPRWLETCWNCKLQRVPGKTPWVEPKELEKTYREINNSQAETE